MKKNLGFTSFEFYFVMAAIGLVVLIGIQRYFQLAEEAKRFSFEIAAKNFSAAVYNYHARWIIARKDQVKKFQLTIDGKNILFLEAGWPLSVDGDESKQVSIKSCVSLWRNFLQSPPELSYDGGDAFGTRTYHLNITNSETCRFEFVTSQPHEFYFDYTPRTGDVTLYTPPIEKK